MQRNLRSTLIAALCACGALFAACSGGGSTSAQQAGGSEPEQTAASQDASPTAVVGAPTNDALPTATANAPAPTPTYAHEWFVAAQGGSDSASGSTAQPFLTINHAISVAGPGDRIVVRAGSYREDVRIFENAKDGTAEAPILLQGEGNPKILPAGASTVVLVARPHWTIDGIEVELEGTHSVGVGFMGSTSGSSLKNSQVHHGTAGAGVEVFNGASDVTIEDNKIFDIFNAPGVDAHGVLVEWTTKNTTVRNNTIYGNSGDGVQCEGPEPYGDFAPADGLLVENNDLSGNFEQALDVKTCRNVTVRNNHIHDFPNGGGCSVVIHMSASNVLFENNLIENVGKAIALGGNHVGPMPAGVVIRNNHIRGVHAGPGDDGIVREGVAFHIENADHPVVDGNTIVGAETADLQIGYGEGGPTDGLTLKNNVLTGAQPLKLGSQAPGLQSSGNLFESTAQVNGQPVGTWLQSLGDTTSKSLPAPLCNPDTFEVTAK